jgi:anti-sigma B factor antagonist
MTSFSVQRTGDGSVSVMGEIDAIAAPVLEAACADAGDDVRIECRDCEFIDSAGVSALLRIRSAVTARGGSVTLVDPSPAVERILAITGLGEAFGVAAG